MSTSPQKRLLSQEIVLFELFADNKHPTQNTTSGTVFLGFQNAYAVIRKFLMDVCSSIPIHVVSKMVKIGAG